MKYTIRDALLVFLVALASFIAGVRSDGYATKHRNMDVMDALRRCRIECPAANLQEFMPTPKGK